MSRVLLLIPTTSYRTQAFVAAARRLGVHITVGSEQPNLLAEKNPAGLLTLDFENPDEAVNEVIEFNEKYPIRSIIGVDDQGAVLAAQLAEKLGLSHNSVPSVAAARNKFLMRERLRAASIPQPHHRLFSFDEDPEDVAQRIAHSAYGITFPIVAKPLLLAASRGVIRANDEAEFISAFNRIKAILHTSDVPGEGAASRRILVEEFVPGEEVAVEGLLSNGKLRVLAVFDKPNPLEGPFFEETIYVTPSRFPKKIQNEMALCAASAARALGLRDGPIHAELRWNEEGPWLIEIAARSIGGYCSRALRFVERSKKGEAISLEELLLRHSLGLETETFERESPASGVMMIPIPHAGTLEELHWFHEARAVKNIEDIVISIPIGETLVPLPEGGKYLGFIFSRATSPEEVEEALRAAHACLEFVITSVHETVT